MAAARALGRGMRVLSVLLFAACARPPAPPRPPAPVRAPIALTYLGVAGWRLDAGAITVLADPYLSRPVLDGPISPDPVEIARHAPPRADAIVIGHSHVDHLLDAPEVALRTGAQLIGSISTARYARASGLPDAQIVPVRGGEDYAFDGFSVRVIPSLHSALDDKHFEQGGEIASDARPPLTFDQFADGGTFAYLVRVGGHEVLFLSTANFIERELAGVHPDIAVVATGLREEIHDYACRLMKALDFPEVVLANHFDAWREAPVDDPPDEDLRAFEAEINRCSPGTRVIIPRHFERMTF